MKLNEILSVMDMLSGNCWAFCNTSLLLKLAFNAVHFSYILIIYLLYLNICKISKEIDEDFLQGLENEMKMH